MLTLQIAALEQVIESLEANIQRVEVKYPLYAKSLRTKLVRKRLQLETIRQQLAAEQETTTSDNFADGGRRKR